MYPFIKRTASNGPGILTAVALTASMIAFCPQAKSTTVLPTLTTIRQVRQLSPKQAQQGYPIRVRAVVTFYHVSQPAKSPAVGELGNNMFIQDGTGGNWIGPAAGQPSLKVGDFIELEGTTAQTDFAPDIVKPRWRLLGSAPLPLPVKSEFGRLASTKEDSSWVELDGVIRSAALTQGNLRLEIAMDGGRVVGYVPDLKRPLPANLIDSEVQVQGVCGASFSEKNQVLGVNIFIPSLDKVSVLEPGLANPFDIPVQSISSILRFKAAGTAGHRVRIHGIVTLWRPGQYAYIQGPDGSTRAESSQTLPLRAGDVVDAVGFPLIGDYAPILQQTTFRVLGHTAVQAPLTVQIEQLLDGNHDGDFVQIDAKLLDRLLTPGEQILIGKANGAVLQFQLEDPDAVDLLQSIEPGSLLRLKGISTTAPDHKGNPGAIRILLRTPADIGVLSRPSWLTFQHTGWVVTGLSAVIFAVIAWLVILRQRIQVQTGMIRKRLESEAALEHRHRQLFERNLAGVYRIKLDGSLLDCNDACARILGCSDRIELLHSASGDSVKLSMAVTSLLTQKNKSTSSELCLQRKDGRNIWALVNADFLDDDSGDRIIEGTIVEITELKQTVEILQERTAQLSALLDNNPLAISVMDPHGIITLCNPAFERLFLFDSSEVIGRKIQDCIFPPHLATEREEDFRFLDAGKTIFRTTRRMRKDSVLVDVEVYKVPLFVDGRISGCFGIYLDIHQRLSAEAELTRLKEAAEAASRAKSAFLANISHEIRTPLSGVLMAANLAAAESPTPGQKEYLEIIIESGKSLQLLLNDVLDLSKIEAGKMELQISAFSLRECLTDCMRLLGNNARQKGLDLSLTVAEDVPDWVLGDALRLRQIVLNLLGNSIKFTQHGSVTISTRCRTETEQQLSLEFSVKDTGIGIPPEKQSLVFQEFEQAENTTRIFGGTGLGLAISRKLATLMQGEMWLESIVGQGTVFYFTASFERAKGLNEPAGADPDEAPGRILKILLAEDNVVNSRLLVRQLENYGHLLTAVSNGQKAVAISSERVFDVILMDVHMPEMDGIEATRRIRQRESGTGMHVPIVALTAGAMKQDREACLAAGMDAYVSKPAYPDELLSKLSSVLRSSRSQANRQISTHHPV